MNIIQTFYDELASHYDKLFDSWQDATKEQAEMLDKIFRLNGFDKSASVLDCACGIGTQAVGLALLGYNITASDISDAEIDEAKRRSADMGAKIHFEHADFCELEKTFAEKFDIVICMDNALPHMLTREKLESAVKSITDRIASGGMLVAGIRDYDEILTKKPPYSPPYIHKTDHGQRVCFQTWDWEGERYRLTQYIIEDGKALQTSKFSCEYRATRRCELTELLNANNCSAEWKFPDETGFYQPIVVAKKH